VLATEMTFTSRLLSALQIAMTLLTRFSPETARY